MEGVALTTAMADARAAIQATLNEIQGYRRQIAERSLNTTYNLDDHGISVTLQACNDMLAVMQLHLSYISQQDNLLLVPGTNAENSELQVADYGEVTRLFDEIFEQIRHSPVDFQWNKVAQRIRDISQPLQRKFAKTLAAFGVEVWSWSVTNIRLSIAQRDELRDSVQNLFENVQHSLQTITRALKDAEEQTVERLGEIKEQQNPL